MSFDLDRLVRPNISRLKAYSSARSEFAGRADVFLDANENAFGSPAGDAFNRYPDPLQKELKARIAEMNDVEAARIFVGNGSDEAIDLLFRIFCEPGKDECIVCPPTYGMYQVSADINDVAVRKIPLTSEFQLAIDPLLNAVSKATKLLFICSPNNPTGNLMRRSDVLMLADAFDGIVVVDEAYIHFADAESLTTELNNHSNVVVLQTFSKAWAMAGLRVGLAFAGEPIIGLMNRVKPPYNVSGIAQWAVLNSLENQGLISGWIEETLAERSLLLNALAGFSFVEKLYPSDANFLLVKTTDANAVYQHLIHDGVVVRNRNTVELCEGCLRITVGTREENRRLLRSMESFSL